MYYYELYGLTVQSNFEFIQLVPIPEDTAKSDKIDIYIEMSDDQNLEKEFSADISEGTISKSTENGMWFRNQAGNFLIESKDGCSRMLCERFPGVDVSIVRSFLLGNSLAILMTLRKRIVLHGSTLVMGDKTFMICGDSGAGKSTLSMAMLNEGAKLMADDISVLDISPEEGCCIAYPGFPEQKLCEDAAINQGYELSELRFVNEDREKYSIDRSDIFLNEKRRIDAMFIIHRVSNTVSSTGVDYHEVTGAEKINAITSRFFLETIYGSILRLMPEDMMKCVALAGQISVVDMTRAENMDTLDELKKVILTHI